MKKEWNFFLLDAKMQGQMDINKKVSGQYEEVLCHTVDKNTLNYFQISDYSRIKLEKNFS